MTSVLVPGYDIDTRKRRSHLVLAHAILLCSCHLTVLLNTLSIIVNRIDMSHSQTIGPSLSALAASALKFSPTAWLKSWLLYLGIETHVRGTIEPSLKPLHSVCEYLHALHIYTDEARRGEVRTVSAHHFCSHVSKGMSCEFR